MNADSICDNQIEPISEDADFDVNDLRAPSQDPFPPDTFVSYLQNSVIQSKIGAQSVFQECSDEANQKFIDTGDGKPVSPVQL